MPTKSIWSCYKDILPMWVRQMRDEDYYLVRNLTSKPCRPELHDQLHIAAAE